MRMRIKRVNYEEAVNYIEEIPKFTKRPPWIIPGACWIFWIIRNGI